MSDSATTSAAAGTHTGESRLGDARRIMTFPHMGDYHYAIRALADLTGADVLVPPKITRKTIELGAKHSPEFVCVPFKYNLGNFIEALDRGANVVVQVGGGCRFSYYAEVQEAILRDLGYEFEFIRLEGGANLIQIMREFRAKAAPDASMPRIASAMWRAFRKGEAIDEVQDYIRKNLAFETEPGALRKIEAGFLKQIPQVNKRRETDTLLAETMERLRAVPLDKPEKPMRVLVVGELYVVMEPFSNYHVEEELSRHGVEVHRQLDLSTLIKHSLRHQKHIGHMKEMAAPYLTSHIGAEGTESVALTIDAMKQGFDGVVHLKPFGCMPEVNAMSALQRISREETFPILFVSCDSQAGEAGLKTRVEAFCDMLRIREEGLLYA